MGKPNHDPSVEHEPHLGEGAAVGADLAGEPALSGAASTPTDVDHTVWDEPSLVAEHGPDAAPEGQLTYARWLAEGVRSTTWRTSWLVTLGLVLSSGPWGVLGAFTTQMGGSEVTLAGLLAATVLAPVTEEIVKVAGALWAVEKRPYWFKSMWQILACAAAGGAAFALIENLIYLYVYHPGGGEAFRSWRWTVCTGLHVNCSMVAGFGLVRIWDKAIRTHTRPELALGMPMFALAMIGHGFYNFGVTVAELAGWLTFE